MFMWVQQVKRKNDSLLIHRVIIELQLKIKEFMMS